MSRKVKLQLLPHERAALLKWSLTPELRDQLETHAASDDVVTVMVDVVTVRWAASDLTHAIIKRGCRDEDVFDLSERLEYVEATGDGALSSWY